MRQRGSWLTVLLALCLLMTPMKAAAAGNGDGGGGGNGGKTPLTMISSYPADGAVNVAADTSICLKFTHNVCDSGLLPGNLACLTLTDLNGNVIPAETYAFDPQEDFDQRKNLYIRPLEPLAPGTGYMVRVAPGVTARNGMTTASEQLVRFATAGAPEAIPTPEVTPAPARPAEDTSFTPKTAGGKIKPIEKIEPIDRMDGEGSGQDDRFEIDVPKPPRPERPQVTQPTPKPVPTVTPFEMPETEAAPTPVPTPTPEVTPTVAPSAVPTAAPTPTAAPAEPESEEAAESPVPVPVAGTEDGNHGGTPSPSALPEQDISEDQTTGSANRAEAEQADPVTVTGPKPEAQLPDNTGMIAGIVVVVIAMGALMFYMNRKKQEAPAETEAPKSFGETFQNRVDEHNPPAAEPEQEEAERPDLPPAGYREGAEPPHHDHDNQRPPDLF